MTDDLVQFLRARLDKDEQAARLAIEAEFLTSGQWMARGPYGEGDRFGNIQSELNEQIIEEDLPWPAAAHIARHDPARVLAEVDAKRRMLDELDQAFAQRKELAGTPHSIEGAVRLLTSLRFVKLLALPYADHPDYRPEWAPGSA